MGKIKKGKNESQFDLGVKIIENDEIVVTYGWHFVCCTSDQRAKAFTDFFEKFHEIQLSVSDDQITKISFGEVEISESSLDFIAYLLMRFHNLKTIMVGGNSCRSYWPRPKETPLFYEAIKNHTSLVSLALQDFGYLSNPIPLFDAIDSSSISEFDLSGTSLKCSKKIVERITISIFQNKTLTSLNLECNPFEVNSKGEYRLHGYDWTAFERTLEGNTSLTKLILPVNFDIRSRFIKDIVSRNQKITHCDGEISKDLKFFSSYQKIDGFLFDSEETIEESSPKKQKI